jgi:hypothetical protein
MVDEATDFSILQLACMESLTSMKCKSFFACGDFNQRITSTGIRSQQQLTWISPHISVKPIQLVYRQSRTDLHFMEVKLSIQASCNIEKSVASSTIIWFLNRPETTPR